MKKIVIIIFVFSLVFFTAFIKNSSKKIEDEIFLINESLRDLKKELGDTKLEFEYLSSTEKLLEYQTQRKECEKELIKFIDYKKLFAN